MKAVVNEQGHFVFPLQYRNLRMVDGPPAPQDASALCL
jgi:hypothetical protein